MHNKGLFAVFGADMREREILCTIFSKLYVENNFITLPMQNKYCLVGELTL